MSLWYTAHILLVVRRKDGKRGKTTIWENVVLIKADSEDEAFAKATQRGKEEEGDDNGTFRWDGTPAQWVFAGIRKLTLCDDPEKRPRDGTEVSYTEMEVESEQAVAKLLEGKPVSVQFKEPCAELQARGGSITPTR